MLNFFKKRKFILFIYILFVAVISLIIYSLSFLNRITILNQQRSKATVGKIYGDIKIGQTFIAEYDNLSAIDVLLASSDKKTSGEFIFHLKNDIKSKEDLFHRKGNITKIKDYEHFKFPKIKNSKGKTFYFFFEAPQSQPYNAITIWSHSSNLYKNGEKIVNGVGSIGDLVFKTTYSLGFKESLNIFLEKIIQNKPFPMNKKLFYITLILLFILSSSLFLTFLVKFLISD